MEEEEWRDIPEYEGYYQVSNLGRVKSLERTVERVSKWGTLDRMPIKEKILKPCKVVDGYLSVNLYLNKKHRQRKIHILVASAFIGPRPENCVIRHLDGNPENNRLDNLKYGTQSENIIDCYRYNGRLFTTTIDQARETKYLLANTNMTCKEIAERVGVSRSVVKGISSGRRFKWLKI